MKQFQDKEKTRRTVNDLYNQFLKGKKLTVEEVIDKYFAPRNRLGYMLSNEKVRSWFSMIKTDLLNKKGIYFGNIDNQKHFGIPTNDAEAKFVMTRYYNRTKGYAVNAGKASKDLSTRHLLPAVREERLLISKVINRTI